MSKLIVFLDDGGVMNQNKVRASQWYRLVGEFFSPILGGAPEAWAETNRVVSTRLFEPANWQRMVEAAPDYHTLNHDYKLRWLDEMCADVGVPTPPEQRTLDLVEESTRYITQRVRAAFPGAVEAIRELHAHGYELHTASGESSLDLTGYLTGMGVLECFGRLYGPDLINTLKGGPAYYERIFADLGIAPQNALIVDDTPLVLQHAASVGAHTVLVARDVPPETTLPTITSLAELPSKIDML